MTIKYQVIRKPDNSYIAKGLKVWEDGSETIARIGDPETGMLMHSIYTYKCDAVAKIRWWQSLMDNQDKEVFTETRTYND